MVRKLVISAEEASRRMSSYGKGKGFRIYSDLEDSVEIKNVEFFVEEGKFVHCIIHYKFRILGNDFRDGKTNGYAHLHSDDKWDEKIGKKIAFAKAMANAFELKSRVLFG